ncbi:MAG: hemerythrin family protein [Oscillospiraceae bacterium]|nr:hemerythrin family protein [Oscillospiraceae bacterium]MCL2279933.1 hemerythrin family protein [Oscillospiraceae bacterium]
MLDTIKKDALVWRDGLRLGDEKIDNQHESLFKKAMELHSAATGGGEDRKQKCIEIILFLKDYAVQHFADEEAYQQSIGYKDYEMHKKIHDEFKKDIGVQEKLLVDSDFADNVVKGFTGMLIAWLVYHVSDADQRIVKGAAKSKVLHSKTEVVCESICKVWNIMNILDSKDVTQVESDVEPLDEDIVVAAELGGDIAGNITIVYPLSFVMYLVKSSIGFEPETIGDLETSLLVTVSNFIFQNISELISEERKATCFAHPAIIASKYAIDTDQRIALDTGKGKVGVGITLDY